VSDTGNPVRVTALVVAAGSGTRLAGPVPKGLRALGGEPLFLHSLRAFDACPSVGAHVVVAPPGFEEETRRAAAGCPIEKPLTIVPGGARRQDSVLCGLEAIASAEDREALLVAVHDAARPFPDRALIERTIAAARRVGAAVPMVPVADTVREIDPTGRTAPRLVDREPAAGTAPQTARLDWLVEAYRRAGSPGPHVTDEGAALALSGRSFAVVEGSRANFKITTPEELEAAEALLAARRGPIETRLGFGEDRHPRAPERPFVLAGVVLSDRDGPVGHSDGDPLSHAIVDALLGAAGQGTIGEMFPDDDPRWAGAAGLALLAAAAERVAAQGWRAVNVDAVVIAETPRLAPRAAEIRSAIAGRLGIEVSRVSVKGKRAGARFRGRARASPAVRSC
jgi:2-C-methyl-D-erythritol 4-phosphate cytidylyltransferase/2-C-methyl-D-erythritol 2,4-cyclodiphosphate synthase